MFRKLKIKIKKALISEGFQCCMIKNFTSGTLNICF